MAGPYNYRWQRARLSHLKREPLCRYHLQRGETVAASVVDHITPHRGDSKLFWDRDNWQSLCESCHNSIKQREEKSGAFGCGLDGIPLDPSHHWSA